MKHLTFKQKVVQGIHDLFYIWIREFRTTFRDQGVLIFFVLVPLVYPLIYAFIYTNETIREVPAVVVDNSRSSLSRESLRQGKSQHRTFRFLPFWKQPAEFQTLPAPMRHEHRPRSHRAEGVHPLPRQGALR